MSKYFPNKTKNCSLSPKTVRIVFIQEKLTHSRPLLRSLNALNVYQINIYQHLNFIHKVSNNVAPLIFKRTTKL